MNKPRVRVLIVEDDKVDRMACRRALLHHPDCDFTLLEADTGSAGLMLARSERPDCILLDYQLPDINGLEFLTELADELGEIAIPVIKLTGADNAAVAVEAMKRGARDYLVKDVERQYLHLLPAVIERVLREQRLMQEKRQAEAKYRTLVEQIPAITYIAALEEDGGTLFISPQIAALGYSQAGWLADPKLQRNRIHPEDRARVLQALSVSRTTGQPLHCAYRLLARNGDTLWFRDQASVVRDESGQMLFLQGVLIDITEGKQQEEELRQSRELLRQLGAHHESVREEERKRIAREIHDELGQKLTALQLEVSILNTLLDPAHPQLPRKVNSILNLIDTTIESVRTIAADLRPAVLDLGLVAAFEWQLQDFEERTGIACALEVREEEIILDDHRTTAIFRILQESLTNVARHAQATRVRIALHRENGVLSLRVEDNGIGIGHGSLKKKKSFGLSGIRERTRLMGGEFSIQGEPGAGTVVAISIPVDREEAAL